MRYNSTLPEHSWLRQIMDMFNVEVGFYLAIELLSIRFIVDHFLLLGLSDSGLHTTHKYHGNAFTFMGLFGRL